MKILAVDDEKLQLEALREAIEEAQEGAEITCFSNAFMALEHAEKNQVDVAFVDIRMPGMQGIELAKKMKVLQPQMNIVFCTAYTEYALTAMELRASGYLTKPVTAEGVRRELDNLRFPVAESAKVRIRCFGNFEIFVNDVPLHFSREKSKEVIAYLVDREGAVCTNAEIIAAIWNDDEEHISYMQKIRADIRETLKAAGCEDIIVFFWGKISLVKSKVSCDYFDWLEGKTSGINAYKGEYMSNYSWAEYTNGNLSAK